MCGSCGKSSMHNIASFVKKTEKKNIVCDYTLEDVEYLTSILECAEENSLIDSVTLNIFKGVLKSISNSPSYICMFKKNIDKIYYHINNIEDC